MSRGPSGCEKTRANDPGIWTGSLSKIKETTLLMAASIYRVAPWEDKGLLMQGVVKTDIEPEPDRNLQPSHNLFWNGYKLFFRSLDSKIVFLL